MTDSPSAASSEVLPAALPVPVPGSAGQNFIGGPLVPHLALVDDHALLRHWLAVRSAGSGGITATTAAAYATEARRLLWWLEHRAGHRRLVSMGQRELVDYLAFLSHPDKDAISPTRVPDSDPAWRPYRKAPAASSARQSQVILKCLFTWLCDVGVLAANPMAGFRAPKPPQRQIENRYLPTSVCEAVIEYLDIAEAQATTLMKRRIAVRDRFMFLLFARLGLRTSEALSATMSNFRLIQEHDGSASWHLHVVGKGSKERNIPADSILPELRTYRQLLRLSPDIAPGDRTPLLHTPRRPRSEKYRTKATADFFEPFVPIRSRTGIYRAFKDLFARLDDWLCSTGRAGEAPELRQASSHWLRHTYATSLANKGVHPRTVAEVLGHVDLNTQRKYLHGGDVRRAKEIAGKLPI